MEQNRGPRNKSTLYTQLIFNRGSKHIQWANNSLFNKWCWENWTDMYRTMKLDHLLTPHSRINSIWIKDLNNRPETIKILEENVSSKILDTAGSNILSDISPQAREMRKNKQMKLYRTKKFLHSRRNHQQNKKTILRMGENIYTNTSDKR